MAKKKTRGRSGGRWLNPPFDPRILQIGVPAYNGKKLTRGRLVNADTGEAIRFLYNPISVDVSHSLAPELVGNPDVQQENAPDTQMGNVVGIGSISVPLLYDRTYETWDGSLAKTLPGRFGMYSDVLAYYHFLGITERTTQTGSGDPWKDFYTDNQVEKTWQSLYPSRPMAGDVLAYLYIGDKLKFYGQVTSFSVTYTHFTHKMIPSRGAVNISLMLQEDPNSGAKILRDKKKVDNPFGGGPSSPDGLLGGTP